VQNKPSSAKHNKLEHFEVLCRQKGLPLTVQRRVVLEALLGRTDHPTVDQVFDEVKSRIPGISRTTVYRVLETLVRLGVARRTHHFEAAARFDGNVDHHHHLVCLGCERVVDLDDIGLDHFHLPDTRRSGFEITDYSVQFEGFCADCRKKRPVSERPKRKS
jgi:Fur family peroxide stress response transcriptional regulator